MNEPKKMELDCDNAWEQYCLQSDCNISEIPFMMLDTDDTIKSKTEFPKCSKLYISTTTKISYLSESINLFDCFWKIPVISYTDVRNGVVKKQVKISFESPSAVEDVKEKLRMNKFYNLQQITFAQNESKKIYKDIRKINIGLCEKDVLSFRSKKKSAFYNCFVLILRIFDDAEEKYKECHIKVFNTGKLELPGIKSFNMHRKILDTLINILQVNCQLLNIYCKDHHETVLINSNFHCGYCLNREKLANILRSKYNIETSYDPCSYPGIMSKIQVKTTKRKISFMIFRTGSVLIVGKCEESDIYDLYNMLNKLFEDEYREINVTANLLNEVKSKRHRVRRKTIKMQECT